MVLLLFLFYAQRTFALDQLATDDWDTLQARLKQCYPVDTDGDKCKVLIDLASIESTMHIQICESKIPFFKADSLFTIYDEVWGTCSSESICLPGFNLGASQLSNYVGETTVQTLGAGCNCPSGTYGPFCQDWGQPPQQNLQGENFCVNGLHNTENYLTGCDCRNDDGEIIPFHGWYCEHHNSILCSGKKPFFYSRGPLEAVGETGKCKSCTTIIPGCSDCIQDDSTNCK